MMRIVVAVGARHADNCEWSTKETTNGRCNRKSRSLVRLNEIVRPPRSRFYSFNLFYRIFSIFNFTPTHSPRFAISILRIFIFCSFLFISETRELRVSSRRNVVPILNQIICALNDSHICSSSRPYLFDCSFNFDFHEESISSVNILQLNFWSFRSVTDNQIRICCKESREFDIYYQISKNVIASSAIFDCHYCQLFLASVSSICDSPTTDFLLLFCPIRWFSCFEWLRLKSLMCRLIVFGDIG